MPGKPIAWGEITVGDAFSSALTFSSDRSADTFQALVYQHGGKRAISAASITLTSGSGLTIAGVIVTVALTAAQTTALGPGRAVIALSITPSGGGLDTILKGELIIRGAAEHLTGPTSTTSVTVTIGTTEVAIALTLATVDDGSITLAKMADLAESRIIGRAESAGTGAPTALTPAQTRTMLDLEMFERTAVAVSGNTSGSGLYRITGASVTLTVTSADIADSAVTLIIKNESSSSATIATQASETIEDLTSITLLPRASAILYSDGTNLRQIL